MIENKKILDEFNKRVFEESYVRIFKCLSILSEEDIWNTPNSNIPSVGNLVLHLCGNGRQWILTGLGKKPDNRNRAMEFASQKNIRKSDLVFILQNLKTNINLTFEDIKASDLNQITNVQGFELSGLSILVHVIEHFSYHTGQISLLTKLLKNIDLDYYKGRNLNSPNNN